MAPPSVLVLPWKPLLPHMINLSKRAEKKELLDSDNIPFADIKQNMKELNTVNTLLGGHAITIEGIRKISSGISGHVTICEIGCGGGDNLSAIAKWCRKKNIDADLIGIDIKRECIEYAQMQYPDLNTEWLVNDYARVVFRTRPSIVFSSLFCHHFRDDEMVAMLQWMQDNSSKGFFINDLHRHPAAYYSIKWITGLFSRSYLVKNDAPLSVARSFKRKEWEALLQKAGIRNYSIQWKWAFRYLVICKK